MSALSANEAVPAPECFSELLVKIAVEFFFLFCVFVNNWQLKKKNEYLLTTSSPLTVS